MSIIFRKIAKGVHEMETREYRFSPRVRSNALILVDGRRNVAALQALMPQQVDGTLEMLREQAFIEVIGETLESPPPRAAADARNRSSEPPMPAPAVPFCAAPANGGSRPERCCGSDGRSTRDPDGTHP